MDAAPKHYPTFWQSLLLLLSALPFGFLAALATYPFISLKSGIALGIIYVVSMTGAACLGLRQRRNWQLKLNAFPIAVLVIALAAAVSMEVVLELFTSLMPPPDLLMQVFTGVQKEPVIHFMLIVIAAPVLEEILMRGIILDGFLKNYKPVYAILLSAFLFALIHGNMVQGTSAFAMGILLGWIYWKTQSIIPCVLMHLFINLLGYIGILYSSEEDFTKSLRETIGNDPYYAALYLGSLVMAIASVWFLQTKFFKVEVSENQA